MLLSTNIVKILDDILSDDVNLDDKSQEEKWIKDLKKSTKDGSSYTGGGASNKRLLPAKRKATSDDDHEDDDEITDNQQQDQFSHFETLKDALNFSLELFEKNKEMKDLNIIVILNGTIHEKRAKGSLKEFRVHLVKNIPQEFVYYKIQSEVGNEKAVFFLPFDNLAEITIKQVRETIREKFRGYSIVDIINQFCTEKKLFFDKVYCQNLVKCRPSDVRSKIRSFSSDYSKATAIVISGESGSGKSCFVKNEFIGNGRAIIYHSIDDEDLDTMKKFLGASPDISCISDSQSQLEESQSVTLARWKLAKVLSKLFENGHNSGELYDCLSILHYEVNLNRNTASLLALDEILSNKFFNIFNKSNESSLKSEHAQLKTDMLIRWWKGEKSAVNELVLIIDEAGKRLDFSRGLVDSVRKLHRDWQEKNRCQNFKLVLAGSGLEGSIRADSLEIDDETLSQDLASFGTDPMKSDVFALLGPSEKDLKINLEKWIEHQQTQRSGLFYKVEVAEAISKGIYSRVLATNSRMLFDGVLPALCDEKLTFGLTENMVTQRLIEVCSTNIVMDYAARKYVGMNGLHRKTLQQKNYLLEKAFKYLLGTSYEEVKSQNEFAYDTKDSLVISKADKTALIQLGLVTNNPRETSAALRYLTCEGHSVELIESDGRSFEALLVAHLRRFEQVVRGFSIVRIHDLREAWPPMSKKSFKGDANPNLKKRFSGHIFTDVTAICQLLKEQKNLAIVMKQRVPSAQGADVIVLESVWSDANESFALTLDLYQAKHYKEYPRNFMNWSLSLGITMDSCDADDAMFATYSDLGIKFFLNCLKKCMLHNHGRTIEDSKVRNRVLVVSGTVEQTKWEQYQFEAAKKHGLRIWTSENLEPSFSAITGGDSATLAVKAEGKEESWPLHSPIDDFFSDKAEM